MSEEIQKLESRVKTFADASLSEATKKAYESDWTLFHQFCQKMNLSELPATPKTVALYLAELADRGFAVATISRKVTSISTIHEACGYKDGSNPIKNSDVSTVLQGIKKKCGRPQDRARAISWTELLKMVSQCDCLMFGCRDRAILLLGWASALRRSELSALNIEDLEFTVDGLLVTVRRSKTDQEGHGRVLGIPRAKNPDHCPVSAVSRWIERAQLTTDRESAVFGRENPLFYSLGKFASKRWFSTPKQRLKARNISLIVKKYGALTGLPVSKISAHSLRRGLATEAGARGVPERIIARHTGHLSTAILRQYIADGTIWNENPLHTIYSPLTTPTQPIASLQ